MFRRVLRMKAYEYILAKQIHWARDHEIPLIASRVNRGSLAYTKALDQNLFEPMEPEVRGYFLNGDGNEILGSPETCGTVLRNYERMAF